MTPGFHRHPNGGGLVADTAHVDDTAYIGKYCVVYDQGKVLQNAEIRGMARITCNAVIAGNAIVQDDAHVSGDALVTDSAIISDSARVYGNSKILEFVEISDSACVRGRSVLSGNVKISNHAHISDARISDYVKIYGDSNVDGAIVSGAAQVFGSAQVGHGTNITGNVKVYERACIGYLNDCIDDDSEFFRQFPGRRDIVIDQLISFDANEMRRGLGSNVRIFDNVAVYGDAYISGSVQISGEAHVCGYSKIVDCNVTECCINEPEPR